VGWVVEGVAEFGMMLLAAEIFPRERWEQVSQH
jgi:hypothetical protein